MTFKLTKEQLDYLTHSLPRERRELLKSYVGQGHERELFTVIELDEDMAVEIRDWATDELQRQGFDLNYDLTPTGKMLEELIDILYIA